MLEITNRLKLHLVDIFRHTNALKLYEEFLQTQWLSFDEIYQIQWTRLKNLLDHAYINVPYYHNLFNSIRIHPDDIRCLEDFRKLPILTKEIIRANIEDILAKNKEMFKPHKKSTGGSTGVPLQFYIDSKAHSASWAFIYRSWHLGGWSPGDRVVVVGGTSLYPSIYAFKKLLYIKMNNWLTLSAFEMSNNTMKKWINKLRKFKARYMYAYASSAYLLAKYFEENSISNIYFDAIFTTAEVLHPKFRETIERVFSCEVFDTYGGTDGAGFAFECKEHTGLHCTSENSIIEILREDGSVAENGETGEIISTDLFNYSMPFIRYKVGDIAAYDLNPCNCKRGLPLLKNIQGRSNDFVTTRNGQKVHGEFFAHLLHGINWICQFYVVQESTTSLSLYLKLDKPHSHQEIRWIENRLKRKFFDMDINISLTENIPKAQSGKFKFIINRTVS